MGSHHCRDKLFHLTLGEAGSPTPPKGKAAPGPGLTPVGEHEWIAGKPNGEKPLQISVREEEGVDVGGNVQLCEVGAGPVLRRLKENSHRGKSKTRGLAVVGSVQRPQITDNPCSSVILGLEEQGHRGIGPDRQFCNDTFGGEVVDTLIYRRRGSRGPCSRVGGVCNQAWFPQNVVHNGGLQLESAWVNGLPVHGRVEGRVVIIVIRGGVVVILEKLHQCGTQRGPTRVMLFEELKLVVQVVDHGHE